MGYYKSFTYDLYIDMKTTLLVLELSNTGQRDNCLNVT